ncbi:hypothetical protein NN561_016926 [Cricetulus griseus]
MCLGGEPALPNEDPEISEVSSKCLSILVQLYGGENPDSLSPENLETFADLLVTKEDPKDQKLLLRILRRMMLHASPGAPCITRCPMRHQMLHASPDAPCITRCSVRHQVLHVSPGAPCVTRCRCSMRHQVLRASPGAPCVTRCSVRHQVLHASPGAPCVTRCSMRHQVLHASPDAPCVTRCSVRQVLHASPGAPCITRPGEWALQLIKASDLWASKEPPHRVVCPPAKLPWARLPSAWLLECSEVTPTQGHCDGPGPHLQACSVTLLCQQAEVLALYG